QILKMWLILTLIFLCTAHGETLLWNVHPNNLLQNLSLILNSTGAIICPGGDQSCADGYTCCEMMNPGFYSCCPIKNAVCCEDKIHCCPEGNICNKKSGSCEKARTGPSNIQSFNSIINVTSVICPDGQYQCPDHTTCCPFGNNNQFGCCPFENVSKTVIFCGWTKSQTLVERAES
ncbi:hypothetical protein QYM36_012955, partial [Artemia franciscana]